MTYSRILVLAEQGKFCERKITRRNVKSQTLQKLHQKLQERKFPSCSKWKHKKGMKVFINIRSNHVENVAGRMLDIFTF